MWGLSRAGLLEGGEVALKEGTCEQRYPEEKQMAKRRKMQKAEKHKKYGNHYCSLKIITQKSAIYVY